MKNLISILLCLSFSIFVLACGSETCSPVASPCTDGLTYEACCEESFFGTPDCAYVFSDGTEFEYTDGDVSSAAEDAVNYCIEG
jgi:hypothetical protein